MRLTKEMKQQRKELRERIVKLLENPYPNEEEINKLTRDLENFEKETDK